jgi:hypothetical protein
MTPEKFTQHERAARDIIETLGEMSRKAPASPDFFAQVMARAAELPAPRPRLVDRVLACVAWPGSVQTRMALAALLVLACIGAVPQYMAWVKAYLIGVPADALHEARLQEALWEKNFACAAQLDQHSNAYATLTYDPVNVVVWACPSGDVLVGLGSTTEPEVRRNVWVPLETMAQPKNHFLQLVRYAFAADDRPSGRERERSKPMNRVLEQKWLPDKRIKRRVQTDKDKCRDEVINPRTGRVESRPAPCN